MIVLFATQHIAMTPNAIEFLCSMARAASGLENSTGFTKSTQINGIPPTYAKIDQFRGAWDISERLNASYSAAIDFHLLPMERLQAFFDFQEVASLNDISCNYTAGQPTKKSTYQNFCVDDLRNQNWIVSESGGTEDLMWLDPSFSKNRVRTVSELSPNATLKPLPLTADSLMMTKSSLNQNGNIINSELSIITDLGLIPNSCSSSEIDENEVYLDETSLEFVFEDDVSQDAPSPVCPPCPMGFQRALQVDARTSFRSNQSRFHEFMDAILGLTLFECTELWLLSEKSSDLYIVTALHRDVAVQQWSANAKGMRLSDGVDVPGLVLASGRPHWDKNYSTRHLRNNGRKIKKEGKSGSGQNLSPRSELAEHLGMRTAFAVPLAGPSGSISGVLAMYSRAKVEPDALLLTLVHKSVQLISVSATVRPALSRNKSGRGEAHFLSEQAEATSIQENPYSFFCPLEVPSIVSSPEKTSSPFRDLMREKKGEDASPAAVYQQPAQVQVQGKRSWDRSVCVPIPGSSLHRTVSANELIVAPQAIFHSHSMPDNMNLEGYKMDVPRLKRARSIDLGACNDALLNTNSLPNTDILSSQIRQDPQIPLGVEIFDHHSIQWNPFTKPLDIGQIPLKEQFSFDAKEHIIRMQPYCLAVNQNLGLYENINMSKELSKMHTLGHNLPPPTYQHLNPLSLSVPTVSPLANQIQTQTKIESSLDVLNAEIAFANDFAFDNDLGFNGSNSPYDGLTPSAYPPCRVEGCEVDSSHRSPFCVVHAAGGRRCQQEGCNKCAQVLTVHSPFDHHL